MVCMSVNVCVLEEGEKKREKRRERKRDREVWYHQLNNPPTQHLVLSLRPSVSSPTVVRWFSASPLLFRSEESIPFFNMLVSLVTGCSLHSHFLSEQLPNHLKKYCQASSWSGGKGEEKRVNATKWKSVKRRTHWLHANQADVHTFIMLLINSEPPNRASLLHDSMRHFSMLMKQLSSSVLSILLSPSVLSWNKVGSCASWKKKVISYDEDEESFLFFILIGRIQL